MTFSQDRQTFSRDRQIPAVSWAERVSLVGVLALALVLRLVWLDRVPPGVRYDELMNVRMVERIFAGERPIYFQESWGHEPLYHYIQAAAMATLGGERVPMVVGVRLASALLGTLGVLTTYLAARRIAGPAVALVAATLLATSFWSLMLSRFGLRIGGVTPWMGMAAYAFWRGLEAPVTKPSGRPSLVAPTAWFALSGVCMGAMLYTYFAGWMMPFFLAVFCVYVRLFHRELLKGRWPGLLLCLVLPILMFTPLAAYLLRHPELGQRVGQVGSKLAVALRTGDLWPLIRDAWKTLLMFSHRGDPEWLYNIAGRPVFDPLSVAFFYGGVWMSLRQWRDPRRMFILLWLVAGIVPTTITWPAGSLPHSVIAQPAAFILPALAIVAVWRCTPKFTPHAAAANLCARSYCPLRLCGSALKRVAWWRRGGRWGIWANTFAWNLLRALTVATVALFAWTNGYDYFVRWPTFPRVRQEYQASVAAVARYLQSQVPQTRFLQPGLLQARLLGENGFVDSDKTHTSACVSAPYVDHWQPWSEMSFDLLFQPGMDRQHLAGPDVRVCWFDGTDSILFPAAEQVHFFFPAFEANTFAEKAQNEFRDPSQPETSNTLSDLDSDLRALLMEGSVPVVLGYRDFTGSTFDLYRWQDRAPLDRFLASCSSAPGWASPEGPYVAGESEKGRQTLAFPLDFGHRLALLGYTYDRVQASPGEAWRMLTCWRVLEDAEPVQPGQVRRARSTDERPLAIFVHVLDASNRVRASQDSLHVSSRSWQKGDVFIHVHTMSLPPDMPRGLQRVELGVYSPITLARLPLFARELRSGQDTERTCPPRTCSPPDLVETVPQNRVLLQPLNVQ